MSKSIASESNEYDKSREMGGKRGAEDEGDENEEGFIKVPPEESLPISTVVSTAPPSWITKLRKPELRAKLDDWFVKFEKKDDKSVDYRVFPGDVKINWTIHLPRLRQTRKCRSPPHKPSRIRLRGLRGMLRTIIDENPGLASNAWSARLRGLLQAISLQH